MSAHSDAQIEQALAECAAEPVHIPGIIQPAGVLLACDAVSAKIAYASENAGEILGGETTGFFGKSVHEMFGRQVWHELQNALASANLEQRREFVTEYDRCGTTLNIHAFRSGPMVVMELEPASDEPLLAPQIMRDTSRLTREIEASESEQELLDKSVQMLRTVTGFDRVMAYRFDQEFNGEVIAESRKSRLESFLGLRFPHWDIPAQARAIMRKLPLRFIIDADQEPCPILAAHADLPPLDITFAQLRGVSQVHMQYLRNMGTAATMTLSLLVEGQLWGIISFHHTRPRLPAPPIRMICENFLPYLQARLTVLLARERLAIANQIDQLRIELYRHLNSEHGLKEKLAEVAPDILRPFQAQGLLVQTSEYRASYGAMPDERIIASILAAAKSEPDQIFVTDRLNEAFSDHDLAGSVSGGVLASSGVDQSIIVFRERHAAQVRWAGAPEKPIEIVDGMARLHPRGSFQTYIEEVGDRCEPWLPRDVAMISTVADILPITSERSAMIKANIRQQTLMIDELNHRIRNILSLIRSVSRQARRSQSTLDSYSNALEQRITALAKAHDLGMGQAIDAISLKQLIAIEAEPYLADNPDRIRISGKDRMLRTDHSPIVALILHELMTNANKYGALKSENGFIDIQLIEKDGGVQIFWTEVDGPAVQEQAERGFGSTLIEQALPYELDGRSWLSFEPDGVKAEFWLPGKILGAYVPQEAGIRAIGEVMAELEIPLIKHSGRVLVVEDNFIVASDMADLLKELGFEEVEISSNEADALAELQTEPFDLAILDINLGAGRNTTEKIADTLLATQKPFLFVTGYGERLSVPRHLSDTPILTKPVTPHDLRKALFDLLGGDAKSLKSN